MRFLLVLLLSLMSWSVLSQNTRLGRIRKVIDSTGKYTPIKYLAIEHARGYGQKLRFFEESDISFQLIGKNMRFTGRIEQITDSTFFFTDEDSHITSEIALKDIDMIFSPYRHIPFVSKGAGTIAAGGVMFSVIDVLNQVQRNQPVKLSPGLLAFSGLCIGIGLIAKPLSYPKYKISQKRRLVVRFM
ncbi:hypothetical protein GOQ04_19940 [Emticicia sp. ODNR4P]|nr:hypothetical protein [Emticicia sp. ODNR4P]